MTSKRKGAKRGDDARRAVPGRGGPGRVFDPTRDADDGVVEFKPASRSMPAPGVPVSGRQYNALKEKAKTGKRPPSKHAQEDPSPKRRK